MKVKDIDKKYSDAMEQFARTKAIGEEAKKQAEELKAQAEEYANAGDVNRYIELKRLAEEKEAVAYVQQKQVEKMADSPCVSKKEVLEAWKDYAEDYSRNMRSNYDKFIKAKAKLIADYMALVKGQNEALTIRERLGSYIGIEKRSFIVGGGFEKDFPMDYIPCGQVNKNGNQIRLGLGGCAVGDDDAVYVLASLNMDSIELSKSAESRLFRNVLQYRIADESPLV